MNTSAHAQKPQKRQKIQNSANIPNSPKLKTVKETAAAIGITGHALRFYEKLGLVHPEREENGHRFYSAFDVSRLEFITKLRATGMPLASILEYIEMAEQKPTELAPRRMVLERHHADVVAKLAQVQQNLKMIELKISYYKKIEKLQQSEVNGSSIDMVSAPEHGAPSWFEYQSQHGMGANYACE